MNKMSQKIINRLLIRIVLFFTLSNLCYTGTVSGSNYPYYAPDTKIEFSWTEMPKATKYQYKIINIQTDKTIKYVQTKTTKGFLPKEKSEAGKYYVTITGFDKNNNSIDTYTRYFFISDQDPPYTGEINSENQNITFYNYKPAS